MNLETGQNYALGILLSFIRKLIRSISMYFIQMTFSKGPAGGLAMQQMQSSLLIFLTTIFVALIVDFLCFHPCLVSVPFTGSSLPVANFYKKLFTLSLFRSNTRLWEMKAYGCKSWITNQLSSQYLLTKCMRLKKVKHMVANLGNKSSKCSLFIR